MDKILSNIHHILGIGGLIINFAILYTKYIRATRIQQLRHLTLPEFEYDPLLADSTALSIRLLEILPGTGQIECRLKNMVLTQRTSYEALSYCWGTAALQRAIVLNGRIFRVTPNLWTALWHLRSTTEPRQLWIDAICINHRDSVERSAQVRIMRSIYQGARRVLVWLGDEDRHTKTAMTLFEIMAEWYEDGGPIERSYDSIEVFDLFDYIKETDPRITKISTRDITLALNSISKRPWFRRVWVIQEISVARTAIFICGRHKIDWLTLQMASLVLRFDLAPGFLALRKATRLVSDGRNVPLPDIFMQHFDFNATDLRDKIFALVGLAPDSAQKAIEIDYEKDVQQVFLEFTIYCLNTQSNLRILSFAFGCPERFSVVDRPSWGLRWEKDSKPGVSVYDMFALPRDNDSNFAASKSSMPEVSINMHTRIMTVSGFQVDQVLAVCDAHMDYDFKKYAFQHNWRSRLIHSVESALMHNRWYRFWQTWRSPMRETSSQESKDDQFWRTCACQSSHIIKEPGQIRNSFQRADSVYRYFRWGCAVRGKDIKVLYYVLQSFLNLASIRYPDIWDDPVIWDRHIRACFHRRLFVTKCGYVGLGPMSLCSGDIITLLSGSTVPFALRESGNNHRLVGEIYIDGMMHGEEWDKSKCHKIQVE